MNIDYLEDAIGPFGDVDSGGNTFSIFVGWITHLNKRAPSVAFVTPNEVVYLWEFVDEIDETFPHRIDVGFDYPPLAAAIAAAIAAAKML